MRTLYQLPLSPWSQKARWALDHHQIEHRRVDYVPTLGAPWLRLKLRRLRGRVTVPVLVDGDTVLDDSFAIAQYADALGDPAHTLFGARPAEMADWNARAEAMMQAGRALTVERYLQDADAGVEAIPFAVPGVLRPAARAVARVATHNLGRKYATRAAFDEATAMATLREHLDALERALDDGDRDAKLVSDDGRPARYVVGEHVSWADIATSLALQIVEPVDDAFIRLGPASRRCWRTPELAARHPRLLAWRDALFTTHHPRRRGS